jgi:hypothetical protein
MNAYPANWKEIATTVKERAGAGGVNCTCGYMCARTGGVHHRPDEAKTLELIADIPDGY